MVADVGVTTKVPEAAWIRARARVQDAVAVHGVREAGLAATSEAVGALAEVLEGPLPRAADDVDELEDVA